MTSDDALLAAWRAEERAQPEGWDFSSLAGRMRESREPWDLESFYREALASAQHVLDMGTGGGEYLTRFVDHLPNDTTATEGWPPNLPVAQRHLGDLGIPVVEYGAPDNDVDAVSMPFPDDRFDLVLNRHESFSPRELARVIAPGGTFLTQQVGGRDTADLLEFLGRPLPFPQVSFMAFSTDLAAAGFEIIDGADDVGWYEFDDVAALVAFLQLATWPPPAEFSVDRYADRLLALHARTGGRPFRVERNRFWLKGVRYASQT
ncbi:class I SAM-dependent methyltransferase [Calidifontibacter sp. DB0510]|uniref:Class I SAM-dependent methyltransferase n=1 Tax=Metallococcus carri TaxID=1656884 RepID=A0A967B597_9MICO|nr:class I SAM-dependent methyltransferase [Metallococcus carri]NHN55872.1 class I SAM-dependent methyltransferase [Metallococcus carri]NOP38440.1 class I SAM-dependent methyltransferase [Calidifontibacter sp. DB2511S]